MGGALLGLAVSLGIVAFGAFIASGTLAMDGHPKQARQLVGVFILAATACGACIQIGVSLL